MYLKKITYILGVALVLVMLTILTQIGGLILLISIYIWRKVGLKHRLQQLTVFVLIYLISTWLLVPPLAGLFGRERIEHKGNIRPVNQMTVWLNRNYVRSEMNQILIETDKALGNTGIHIKYLDAGFPFLNGFPLLPHLSHYDGKKLDISLIYKESNGNITNSKKSLSGYGVFVKPKANEFNQTSICKARGYWQYDFPKYLTFGKINSDLVYSNRATRLLMNALLTNPQLGKVFIEPHLAKRLNINDTRIRFHGCGAVRHDDHIHIQLK